MDPVFGSPLWIREWLTTNKSPRPQVIRQAVQSKGGLELPRIQTWAGPGRGVQGESTNSQSTNDKQIIRKTWRPSTP